VADKATAAVATDKASPAKASPPPATTTAPPATTAVSNSAAVADKGAVAPPEDVVELKGQTTFNPSEAWKTYLASVRKPTLVPAKFGTLAAGHLPIARDKGETYKTSGDGKLELAHPLFKDLPVAPYLSVGVDDSKISGRIAIPGAGDIFDAFTEFADKLQMVGFQLKRPPKPINEIQNGNLVLKAPNIPLSLAGWLSGNLEIGLENENITFKGTATVKVRGLAEGTLELARAATGAVSGKVSLAASIAKFSGTVTATYLNGEVSVTGQLSYTTEKMKGTVTVVVMEAAEAEKKAREQIDPENLVADSASDKEKKPEKFKKGERGIAGWGELDFAFTDWFTGKAKVIFGPAGYITVVGKIAPPKSLELMKERVWNTRLFGLDLKARYGVPYVADIHVGFSIELGAVARIGPAVLTDIVVDGVYSTDPTVFNSFSISGAFRISAYAGLNLRFEGKAGLTLLGHDVDFGAAITGKAGVKGYAEARPTLGYRETAGLDAGKKGEYYLKGHLELAAQPFVGLDGELFVRLDSPWWSPAPDKTWTWPLFSLEYPLPGEFGIAADIDYVIGSGQFPEIKWGKADFDSSKFTDSLLDDKIPPKKVGGDVPKAGSFKGEQPPPPTAPPSAPSGDAKAPGASEPKAGSPAAKGGAGGGQTPTEASNVPKDPAVAKRWLAGLEELARLQTHAEKDPEDEQEIAGHLDHIKKTYGFKDLRATAQGDEWIVHADMNPNATKKVRKMTSDAGKKLPSAKSGEEGSEYAARIGYPAPEPGYHWAIAAGKPVYKNNPGNAGPEMILNPGKRPPNFITWEKPPPGETEEKARFGEDTMHEYMDDKGYALITARGKSPFATGIDGIYEKAGGRPKYVVGEAKFGAARLKPGQLTRKWVEDRLLSAVENDQAKADDILSTKYQRWAVYVDAKGHAYHEVVP